jgi:plastocyanin
MRRRYLPAVAALGAAVVVLPTVAGSETGPTIEAGQSEGIYASFIWRPSTAEVSAGGTVSFANPSNGVPHGVVWNSGNPETPSCSGVPIDEGRTSWSGTCMFTRPGTYNFHCFVHPNEMTGSITVAANGTITTTATTPTTTTTSTSPATIPTAPTPPAEARTGPALVGSPSVRSSQRGGSVKGSLDVSTAGAGDRLEIDVFAKRASIAARRSAQVQVGRLVRTSVSAGRLAFSVKLDAKALKAIRRQHHLALTVKITLTPVHGSLLTITRAVVEHA